METPNQQTAPAPAAKRQKVEQQDRNPSPAPAKNTAQKIAAIQGKKKLTLEEAIRELDLTGENIRYKQLELVNLTNRWNDLMAIIGPVVTYPRADTK